jgi:hypothetical protein
MSRFESSQLADAVTVEPVSTTLFPANREINSEFCELAASAVGGTANNAILLGLLARR